MPLFQNKTWRNITKDLTLFPETELLQYPELEELYLEDSKIREIPHAISKFTNLRILRLNHHKNIVSLPKEICQLSKLKILDLSSNSLTNLPEEIGQLVQLEELELGGNELNCLPDSIGNLMHLQRLCLDFNRLEQLPETVEKLYALKHLSLTQNYLHTLPDLSKLKNLDYLDIGSNLLNESLILDQIAQLPQLRYLRFSMESFNLSKEQVDSLQKKLPQCVIELKGMWGIDDCV